MGISFSLMEKMGAAKQPFSLLSDGVSMGKNLP